MTVNEYAIYVIDNMHRASAANALNITNKLDNEYNFIEFVENILTYIENCYNTKKLNNLICSKIIVECSIAINKYNSNIKYNNKMIIDTFILKVWEAFNEC